jgi:transposase InsO family protein
VYRLGKPTRSLPGSILVELAVPSPVCQTGATSMAPEFTCHRIRRWLSDLGTRTLFIEPGSPWENGYIEIARARHTTTTITHTYDPVYRLTAADYNGGMSYFHYTFDATGNRLTEITQAGTTSYVYGTELRKCTADSRGRAPSRGAGVSPLLFTWPPQFSHGQEGEAQIETTGLPTR